MVSSQDLLRYQAMWTQQVLDFSCFPWQWTCSAIIGLGGPLSVRHSINPLSTYIEKFVLWDEVHLSVLINTSVVCLHPATEEDALANNSALHCLSSLSCFSPKVVSYLFGEKDLQFPWSQHQATKQNSCILKSSFILISWASFHWWARMIPPLSVHKRLSTLISGRRESAVRKAQASQEVGHGECRTTDTNGRIGQLNSLSWNAVSSPMVWRKGTNSSGVQVRPEI